MSFSEWKEVTLGEISIGNKGSYGIAASAVDYSKNLYKYLRITDITDDGVLKKDNPVSVDDNDAKNYLLKPNDIVFARTGNSTGRSYFYDGTDGELVYAGFLIKFSLDPSKVNPKFIRYYTLSNEYKNWVTSFSTGSTRGNINAKTYGDMKIQLPSREQQDFLVTILSTLDEKIEVNNKINKTLENMAQSIFKEWFVDFEFPNEEGEPYKSSGGEMIESELGMIPKGWEVKALGDICTVKGGKRLPKGKLVQDKKTQYPYLRVTDINNGYVDMKNIKYIDEDTRKLIERYTINYEDVYISIAGTIGLVGTIVKSMDQASLTENMAKIVSENINKYFIKLYLDSDGGKFYIASKVVGSTQPKLPLYAIKSIPVIIPDDRTSKDFTILINSVFKQIENNLNSSYCLSEMRDTLLPKLMSGEIRVPF